MSYPVESIRLRQKGLAAARAGRIEAAEQLLRNAFDAGHAAAAGDLADIELQRGNRDQAIGWWQRGAESNDPACLFEVGHLDEARGDLTAAEGWYRRGVAVGGASCLLNLATILENRGERAEALELYERAWTAGMDKAAFNIGRLLDDGGHGDLEAAALWYTRASELGNAASRLRQPGRRADR